MGTAWPRHSAIKKMEDYSVHQPTDYSLRLASEELKRLSALVRRLENSHEKKSETFQEDLLDWLGELDSTLLELGIPQHSCNGGPSVNGRLNEQFGDSFNQGQFKVIV